ncbi:cell division protein ZapA [Flavobacteriaceae bacterium]|jgi:cell division protein ZapA|nr:cell division protein ZapA [Flavobacteriaceae bacterium]MDA9587743.1 cell division protein ZapA [Flavobacteriaceae bacterium]MDA9851790.1 cell division protein ZapA [Flavobacteriaceae bacterium]MDC0385896.1 cell division protein ZapA [Flavobacteriaceae bacterium]MDC0872409.1 cell division protein ZapA [Flavobacteriaceae bacterium]
MSNLLKIKLTIGNRVYPLSVAPEQEASLRASAKKIEATVQQLEKNYAVRDKQDVLAMCSLQYAAQLEQSKNQPSLSHSDDEKIKELIDMIDVHLDAY